MYVFCLITAFTQVSLNEHQVFLEGLFQMAFDYLAHRLTFAEELGVKMDI